MQVGDFVKGLPESDKRYGITTSKMTKGVVTKIDGECITVKIINHEDGSEGSYGVESKYFEVIGHQKPFKREEVLELLKTGCKKAILDFDLRRADLTGADLTGANLTGADLRRADLTGANLRRADLTGADLTGADLTGANLTEADLTEADLTGANLTGANLRRADLRRADLTEADLTEADLDFSCLPLRCGGLRWKIDKRIACQIAYHLCSMQCDDAEYINMRNSILGFANQFHRVGECGHLNPVNPPEPVKEEVTEISEIDSEKKGDDADEHQDQ